MDVGFTHAAFTFYSESMLDKSNLGQVDTPSGQLISYLQKGLLYREMEQHLNEVSLSISIYLSLHVAMMVAAMRAMGACVPREPAPHSSRRMCAGWLGDHMHGAVLARGAAPLQHDSSRATAQRYAHRAARLGPTGIHRVVRETERERARARLCMMCAWRVSPIQSDIRSSRRWWCPTTT